MFTGDTKIQGILHDINADENGILLQHDVHSAFRALAWGIETQMEDGVCRYFIKESTLGSSSTAQKSEQEQSCTFLTSLATNSRTQTCAPSTSRSVLSLPPAMRQMFSTSFSNTIRTSSVL